MKLISTCTDYVNKTNCLYWTTKMVCGDTRRAKSISLPLLLFHSSRSVSAKRFKGFHKSESRMHTSVGKSPLMQVFGCWSAKVDMANIWMT